MRYKLFSILLTVCFIGFISCAKEPQKGIYKGTFSGKYVTDSNSVEYSTEYYFEVTRSTKKELRLKEEQSQTTSILKKHEGDSISGMIAFGSVFKSGDDISFRFSTILIQGKYDESSMNGRFTTTFIDENKTFPSEGSFELRLY